MGRHLVALVPGQRSAQVFREQSIAMAATRPSRKASAASLWGTCASITWRVVRSTRVPMADWFSIPVVRSPSQCRGIARSSIWGGRSVTMIIGSTNLLRCSVLCGGLDRWAKPLEVPSSNHSGPGGRGLGKVVSAAAPWAVQGS